MLDALDKVDLVVHYKFLHNVEHPIYIGVPDASQGKYPYHQIRFISGICFERHSKHIFYCIDRMNHKQSHVLSSFLDAEILAAFTSTDRGSHVAERLKIVSGAENALPFVPTVDFHVFFA